MNDPGVQLPELFPGFDSHVIDISNEETIFARSGGSGPALLCLHGYPQTHVCWHKVSSALAEHHSLVLIDLPGYGASSAPVTDTRHTPYSKRAMAGAAVQAMAALGHTQFAILSHDRGARVGYRLAMDHPDKVTALITLDIVPTESAWRDLDDTSASGKFHWTFLDRPAPLPETMIGAQPDIWHEYLLASWTGTGDLSPFDERAMEHYRHNWRRSSAIHAMSEDYRAGSSIDREIDVADMQSARKITCPTLALWGDVRSVGGVSKGGPLHVWEQWCDHVTGEPVKSGHFLAEEAPRETLELVQPFLSQHAKVP